MSLASFSWAVTGAHTGYCDDIESTAAALKCINEHKKKSEEELSKAFDVLNTELENGRKTKFLEAHKNWITYREKQCKWEAETEEPSLAKLLELSCITKLTEERTARLQNKVKLDQVPQEAIEFGVFPRWLNTLNKKHPNVVWDVKSKKNYDLNCDDKDEHIIQGVYINNDASGEEESGEQYRILPYLSVVDGQDSGKPKVSVIKLENKCGHMPDLNYIKTEQEEGCHSRIDVPSCDGELIFDGETYLFQKKEIKQVIEDQ